MIRKSMPFTIALLLSGLVGLSSCTLGPDYKRPDVDVAAAYREDAPWKEAVPADHLPKGEWWLIYDDPTLNSLQQKCLEANQEIKAAVARVLQARAALQADESEWLPRLDLTPSARRARTLFEEFGITQGFIYNDFNIPLDLGYELDLWGRVRRSVEAAGAEFAASEAELQNILLTMQADVARNYFSLQSLDAQITLLHRTVELRRKNLELVNSLFRNGQVGKLDVARAETELANAQADSAALERRRTTTEHALAVLLGKTVAEFTLGQDRTGLSSPPPKVSPGLPSRLLERRPDIAAAERQMIAANARIGVAKTAFFPAISLTGSAGYSSSELSTLLGWDHRVWSLGSLVNLPIFDGGRNRAALANAEAAWSESVARYRQQVLVAFREVEDALANIRILDVQAKAQQRALNAAREAADLSQKRYRAGLVSYLEVVVSERTALATELLAAQVLEQRYQASVSLVKALGGGWQGLAAANVPE